MLTESGDEEESDNIVTQVLDEIGIEISGKVSIFKEQSELTLFFLLLQKYLSRNLIQIVQLLRKTSVLPFSYHSRHL